jgi:D-2-hydroxyacid dehydrogenase (NADP+)
MPRGTPPVILLSEDTSSAQDERILAAAPGARLLHLRDIETDAGLGRAIQVAYPSLPAGLWETTPALEWVQVTMAGVDQLLSRPEVRRHPAVITNVHIHADCVAEHLWGMALMLTRNLARAHRQQVDGTWNSGPLTSGISTLRDRWLCVAGLGAIGRRCAEIGVAFGMRVIGISRSGRRVAGVDEMVGPEARREAFARSRIIMLLLPDTTETRHFAGRDEIAACRGAYIINGGRGSGVDTEALVAALREGNVRGAGLDVTDPEPLPPGHALWSMPNVVISPHYAGVHPGYNDEAFEVFLANLGCWMRGETLANIVDRATGY